MTEPAKDKSASSPQPSALSPASRLPGAGMRFQQHGRSFHLVIEDFSDLLRALELDDALWVATSAPIATLHADPIFLKRVDHDEDQRIKLDEFKTAVLWLKARLSDYSSVDAGSSTLLLRLIAQTDAEGTRIYNACKKMLMQSGKAETDPLTLDEIRRFKKKAQAEPVSEAGVVLPAAASEHPEIVKFLRDVIAAVGGVEHPSGRLGVSHAKLVEFRTAAEAYLDWSEQGQRPSDQAKTPILPLGDATADAFALFQKIRPKINQYFSQCEAIRHDTGLLNHIWPRPMGQQVDMTDPESIQAMLESAPIAEPNADRAIDLDETINPAYVQVLHAFRHQVMMPLLGESAFKLTPDSWAQITAIFAEHEAWRKKQPEGNIRSLPLHVLRDYLTESRFFKTALALIASSAETAFVLDNIRAAEKLALYQAHLLTLANNYVSFPHLYDEKRRALFEEGTLIMDGRKFNFALRVTNRAEHIKSAESCHMFVMYVELTTRENGDHYEVAIPVTSGTQGNISVGKRGVFQHIDGRLWDARVVHVIDYPISLREAIWAPFQRLGNALTGRIEAITTSAEKRLDTVGAASVSTVHDSTLGQAVDPNRPVSPPPAAGPTNPPAKNGGFGGTLAGGGIAIAALGSAGAFITKTLASLAWYEIVGGILAAILAVVIPTTIIAMINLRRRDLSPILEGSSWAINARMRLSREQRLFFTQRPRYPLGSHRARGSQWWLVVVILLAILGGVSSYFYLQWKIDNAATTAEQLDQPFIRDRDATPETSDPASSTSVE